MSNPAPGDLELVRAFVNTYDVDEAAESLADPASLASWFNERGLGNVRATTADVERARKLREALRAILLHHDGEPLDEAAPPALEAAARRANLSIRFDDHGAAFVEPLAGGADGALGRLLAIVAAAQRDGTWERLKVCRAHDCQWAFYDQSRNRSAVWCSMEVCGNRSKVRAHRARGSKSGSPKAGTSARAPAR